MSFPSSFKLSTRKSVHTEFVPIVIPSIVPPAISTFEILTSPVPFGVMSMFPFISVDVMSFPSSFKLSTDILLLKCKSLNFLVELPISYVAFVVGIISFVNLPPIVITSFGLEPNVTFPIETSPFTFKSLPTTTLPLLSIVNTFPFCVDVPKANLISFVEELGSKSIFAFDPIKTKLSLSVTLDVVTEESLFTATSFFMVLF